MAGPRVTFLGGVREIGGNKIVIEDGPDRILFDFGPSFSGRTEEFYVNFLQPRSTSYVKDLLEFDLLPRVPGLYDEESLYGADLPYQPPEFHGVFVSHAHFDHAGFLELIDPEIPVFLGDGTRRLFDAIEGSGNVRYGTHDVRSLAPLAPVRIGGLEVVAYPVDHSIPWAYGYLIRTSAGSIAYTGDFRAHGPRAPDTHAFLEAVRAEKPELLIMEGTRAGPDPRRNFTEQGVRDGVDRLLSENPKLATVSCYPRDIDRLTTLYQAARAAEREFVVSMKTAHLLATSAPLLGTEAPVPGRAPGVRVYRRTKKKYYKFEQPFLDDSVDAPYIRAHAGEILLELGLQHFAEMVDIRPEAGSAYIHSMSEPFSEDDVDDRVLHNWIDHFGLGFHQFHASGHCSATELWETVRKAQPRTLVPIHTEHPEAFEKAGVALHLPVKGVPFGMRP
jgi:ribonuclease J